MKHKILFSITALALLLCFGVVKNIKQVDAISEICTGVVTEFTATHPTSVVAGQTINISGIHSRPASSYGYTITSSSLSLSATGATPVSYTNANTSTDPSPTTGHPTYTAYYPNWSLTATGAVGSQIIIKLASATAQVATIGPIVCPLSATLATITITEPQTAAPTTTVPTIASTQQQTQQTSAPVEKPTPLPAITETKAELVEENQIKSAPLIVTVQDGRGRAIKGATVTIGNQLTSTTNADGTASFDALRVGEHRIMITYSGKKIEQLVQVNPAKSTNDITIILPTRSYMLYGIGAGTALMALVLGAALFVFQRYRRTDKRITSHGKNPFIATISTTNAPR